MMQVCYPRQVRQISKAGKQLFEKLDPELREKYYGKFIAIEVDSGDYFIGERGIDASMKAREKYPDKIFFLGRIGHRTAYKFRGHVPLEWHRIFTRPSRRA
jgi:hypothetical protein